LGAEHLNNNGKFNFHKNKVHVQRVKIFAWLGYPT